ncbi:hypothetical protein TVAG_193190 [Trichomonas vaginalis G3]|uniref:UEV domain-containing protein n=1 Tax=Trichomonas vaginalis (strain ATCC PRA-98 / G3) TaxID=412133 RepID=A2DH33_TRIV3|nr:tumor suppressor protein 101 family [Trichomonas vaginalis G3]EAY20343.1 hypothetical protein TVAG_193190 [Trichomonas vaginalis G3]KAI5530666.1 tumor suppressor protein 101 family [Trichomonas vaginalis G3]|eukprot:XP_001581329.1 hypothetical protein [Trichomonas vaginalis G3]
MIQIFQSTVYPQEYHAAICRDIELFIQRYNTLQPRQFSSSVGNLIAISGYLLFNIGGTQSYVNLDITLTPKFPMKSPYIQFRIDPSQICPSHGLTPQGVVNMPVVHNWVFRQSTLLQMGDDLYRFFMQNPPIMIQTPQQIQGYANAPQQIEQKPQINVEELKAEAYDDANKLVEASNKAQAELASVSTQYALMKHQIALSQKAIEDYRASVTAQATQNYAQGYALNPEVEIELRFEASRQAYQETIEIIKQSYQNKSITFDAMLNEIQSLSRQHFFDGISDKLKTYPKESYTA